MATADKSQISVGRRHPSQLATGPSTSYAGGLLSLCARLSIWLGLFTILFRCPNSQAELNETSPRICKPYFDARSLVAPHVEPYYDAYAAPYVDVVRPYVTTFNENVYTPGVVFAKNSYDTYGAAKVAQAQAYGQEQWEKAVIPRFEEARHGAFRQYQASLAPHVDRAYGSVGPYVDHTRAAAAAQYETVLVPLYQKASPYVQTAYGQTYSFATETLLPYSRSAGEGALVFLQRRVWPPLRVLYGENVQPQLDKIRERLASYRDGKKLEAIVDGVESSSSISSSRASRSSKTSSKASQSSMTISAPTTSAASSKVSTSSTTPVSSSTVAASVTPIAQSPKADLDSWRKKFTKAADRGGEDLRERINEITSKQIRTQAHGTGAALITSLEETVAAALPQLKKQVNEAVRELPPASAEDPAEERVEASVETTRTAIKAAGKRIKESAQHLRSWRAKYSEDTDSLVKSATDSTLNVVDGIRDLGLQEIGMRWAGMGDDVSYKDWSDYHGLRSKFEDWRVKLQNIATEHEGVQKAEKEGKAVEGRGMAIAEDAAKEIQRLKEVAVWKIEARDASEDFGTRYGPPGAEKAKQKVMKKASDASKAMAGSTAGSVESAASSVSSKASSAASAATEPPSSSASSASSAASSKSSSLSTDMSSYSSSASSSASASASSMSSKPSDSASAIGSSPSSKRASMSSSGTFVPASGPSPPGGSSAKDGDTFDGKQSSSSSVASQVGEAGEKYTDVTSSLKSNYHKTSTQSQKREAQASPSVAQI